MIWRKFVATFGLWLGLLLGAGSAQESTVLDVPPEKAAFLIYVPSLETVLKFEGRVIDKKGLERLCFTPALQREEPYEYVISATWTQAGQTRSAFRRVSFKTGNVYTIDFRNPFFDTKSNKER